LLDQSQKLSVTVFVYALNLFVVAFHSSLLVFERKTRQMIKSDCCCLSKGDWKKILMARIEITVEVLEPMLLILLHKRLLSALQKKWLVVLRTSSWSSFSVDSLNDF
jgi:hypothetical protein